MSLVFQMISLGNGPSAKTTASPGTPGAAAAGMFSNTLIQSMAGISPDPAAASQGNPSTAALQNLLGKALSGSTGQDGDATDLSGKKLLEELVPDLSKLDEQIESDPALLAALQGWLVQVSAQLSGKDAEPQKEAALAPIAQNPATARFAVQDELNNLAAWMQQASKTGDEASAGKALALFNSFAAMIAPYAGAVDPADHATRATAAAAWASGSNEAVKLPGHTAPKAGDANAGVTFSKAAEILNKSDVSGQAGTASSDSQTASGNPLQLKWSLATAETHKEHAQGNESTSIDAAAEQSSQADSSVITAGQLSLKDGITTAPKAEIPQVPVHRFAEEMSGFISGKLEIVKKGGVAEATLSLFPEHLGQVDVKITMQNGHVVAQFMTEHSGARDLLENQMSQLRAALQSQGLQVEKLEVSQNNTPLQSQLFHDGRHSGTGGQESDKRSKARKDSSDDAVLAAELDSDWKEWLANERQITRNPASQFSAEA